MPTLVPELAQRIPRISKYGSYGEMPVAEQEAWKAPVGPVPDYDLTITDTTVAGPHGDVPIRVYTPNTPAPAEGRPALVWMHGGAYCWGDLDMPEAHQVARGVAGEGDAVVVSVDYHLCPTPDQLASGNHNRVDQNGNQITFPIPQDDCQAVYDAVLANPAKFGINPNRVSVGGASAGAGLAGTMTVRANRAGQPVHRTFLLYPLPHREFPPLSAELTEKIAATPRALQFPPDFHESIRKSTQGDIPLSNPADYFPGGTENVKLFGPTYIENAEFDTFRASGELFGEELRQAGVPVEVVMRPGVPHGHLDWDGLPAAQESIKEIATRL